MNINNEKLNTELDNGLLNYINNEMLNDLRDNRIRQKLWNELRHNPYLEFRIELDGQLKIEIYMMEITNDL